MKCLYGYNLVIEVSEMITACVATAMSTMVYNLHPTNFKIHKICSCSDFNQLCQLDVGFLHKAGGSCHMQVCQLYFHNDHRDQIQLKLAIQIIQSVDVFT